ncbi:MAG: exodeoxyribonuclease VII small subunit [Pirellulales bacterium]|nr:exodeoxyribonuclease VII small subunit [Pirellulales bacterium]
MAKRKISQQNNEAEDSWESKAPSMTFEESLVELERIVAALEGGKLGLSDALAQYERGVRYLQGCQRLLESAERKIELLSGVDAEGNPVTMPFEEGDVESIEGRAASRGQRRTSSSKPTSTSKSSRRGEIDERPQLF